MALDLLLGLIEQRLVEGPPFRQPDFAQPFAQCILVEFLVADEVDLRHRRAFLDHHDQHIALYFQAYVFEESGRKQGLDRRGRLFIGHGFADLDREIAEYGAGLDALDAFDADIAHHEGIECVRDADPQADECADEVSGHVKFSRRSSG